MLNWMCYIVGLMIKIVGKMLDLLIFLFQGVCYQVWMCKELVGVVVGIVLWNFLLMIGMWKVMLVLAVGCLIVIKFLEIMLLMMLCVVELVSEVGIFDGVFNVVIGLGVVCGAVLMLYFYVVKISFIGLIVMGKGIVRIAVDYLMCVMLELGGKNLVIVLKDVDL